MDLHVRYPAHLDIGSCDGKIVEAVSEGGSVMSSFAWYSAVCLRDASHAEWVLLSGSTCGSYERPGACTTPKQKAAFDQIKAISRLGENEAIDLPIARALLGRECAATKNQQSWQCASFLPWTGNRSSRGVPEFATVEGEPLVNAFGRKIDLPLAMEASAALYDVGARTSPPKAAPAVTPIPTSRRLDVPIVLGGHKFDACQQWGQIVGLDPNGDGFLSVRSGPGGKAFHEIDRVYNGQGVAICGEEGPWRAIIYTTNNQVDCGVSTFWPVKQPYTGPCRYGWAHSRYIRATNE